MRLIAATVIVSALLGSAACSSSSDGGMTSGGNIQSQCQIDLDCDDGLHCNGVEACDASERCVAGASPCTVACNEATDACQSRIETGTMAQASILSNPPGIASCWIERDELSGDWDIMQQLLEHVALVGYFDHGTPIQIQQRFKSSPSCWCGGLNSPYHCSFNIRLIIDGVPTTTTAFCSTTSRHEFGGSIDTEICTVQADWTVPTP